MCLSAWICPTTVLWNQSPTAYFLVLRFCGVFVCLDLYYNCAVESVFISLLSSNAFEQVFPQIRSVTLHTFDLLFIISSSVKVVSSLCQLSQAVCRLIDQQHKATIAEVFVLGRTLNYYRYIPCNTPDLEVI